MVDCPSGSRGTSASDAHPKYGLQADTKERSVRSAEVETLAAGWVTFCFAYLQALHFSFFTIAVKIMVYTAA
jgi:hypothetical protein